MTKGHKSQCILVMNTKVLMGNVLNPNEPLHEIVLETNVYLRLTPKAHCSVLEMLCQRTHWSI
jgi:hypothetical protein